MNRLEKVTKEQLLHILEKTWSLQSSSKWCKDIPSKGQCGVTSLVVNDILGGEIRKTPLSEGWHFYNIIQNNRFDFTASQFSERISYEDLPSNREEAYTDTNFQQYNFLISSVLMELRKSE